MTPFFEIEAEDTHCRSSKLAFHVEMIAIAKLQFSYRLVMPFTL